MTERQNYLAEGFRNVDGQTDVEKFKACLTVMETLASFRTYKEKTYRLLRPEEGQVFIDIGCGLGFDVERLAKKSSAKIIGLDASYEFLRDARQRAQISGLANADYVLADARLDCFKDAEFDGARVDRTLQHLESPGGVIEAMARVTRAGGRVVCAEPDWGSFFIDDDDAGAAQEVCRAFTASIKNPFIGRELPRLMTSAGLTNIEAGGYLLATYGLPEVNPIYDVRRTSEILSDKTRDDRFNHWYQTLTSRDAQSPVFAGVTIVIAAGLKSR